MSLRLEGAVVADEAIVSMVRGAVRAVEGARLDRPGRIARVLPGRRGPVEWQVEPTGLTLGLDVSVAYGRVLPEVAQAVRDEVAAAVAGMTGIPVRSVDVTVTDLDRPAESAD